MTRSCFRLEPIMDLGSDETLGFEMLAGAERRPEWTDDGWRMWYARMADLFHAYIPASVRVFINVDAHQVLDPTIIAGLQAIPGRDRLVVEWTEHIRPELHSADFCDASARAFAQLTQSGFSLAIDDVGAGSDGIGRALQSRPAFAKLDMSLTHHARRADPRFLRGLRDLFEGVGAQIIAEGIESAGDLERVRAAGIRYGQGHFFTRRMERAN